MLGCSDFGSLGNLAVQVAEVEKPAVAVMPGC